MAVSATYRSDTNPEVTLALTFTEVSRSGTSVTMRVDWTLVKGASAGFGPGHSRVLYICRSSDGAVLGQTEILNTSDDLGFVYWERSGAFTFSFDVGSTAAGSIALYGITSTSNVSSCTWTNRAYCYDVAFPYSASFEITYNGNSVTSVVYNSNAVSALTVNGTTIF